MLRIQITYLRMAPQVLQDLNKINQLRNFDCTYSNYINFANASYLFLMEFETYDSHLPFHDEL